jgi:hypothetical protein
LEEEIGSQEQEEVHQNGTHPRRSLKKRRSLRASFQAPRRDDR